MNMLGFEDTHNCMCQFKFKSINNSTVYMEREMERISNGIAWFVPPVKSWGKKFKHIPESAERWISR